MSQCVLRRSLAFQVSSDYFLSSHKFPFQHNQHVGECSYDDGSYNSFHAGKGFFSSVMERITIKSAVGKMLKAFAELLRAFLNPFCFHFSSFPMLN